ncbi:MAG: hypothetical protein WCW67_07325 [Candidatus Margulisiibacteriota bacterium]
MTGQWIKLDRGGETTYAVVTIEGKPGEYICPNYFGDCHPITTKQAGPDHNRAEIDQTEAKKVSANTREITFRTTIPGTGSSATVQPTTHPDGPSDVPSGPEIASQEPAEVGYSDRRKREQASVSVKKALKTLAGRGNLQLKIEVDSEGRLTLKSTSGRWYNPENDSNTIPEDEIKRLLGSMTFSPDLRGIPVITFTVPFTKVMQ